MPIPTSDETRGIFRPEMLAYQRRRRAFGEPLDVGPMPGWLCLLPFVGLALLVLCLARITYRSTSDTSATIRKSADAAPSSASGSTGPGTSRSGGQARTAPDAPARTTPLFPALHRWL
jgi:hypothetical protein